MLHGSVLHFCGCMNRLHGPPILIFLLFYGVFVVFNNDFALSVVAKCGEAWEFERQTVDVKVGEMQPILLENTVSGHVLAVSYCFRRHTYANTSEDMLQEDVWVRLRSLQQR